MIYSSITNSKDDPRTDVKCFTDYNRFKGGRMNAKIYKILSHLFIDEEYSVWIDGNLILKVGEEELIKLLGDKDVAVFRNPYKNSVYEEAVECIRLELDNKDIIRQQIRKYTKERFVSHDLGACFLIIRRHTEEVKRLNERWWAEVCRHSSRDQISFPYVFRDKVNYLPRVHPFENKYFTRVGHKNKQRND